MVEPNTTERSEVDIKNYEDEVTLVSLEQAKTQQSTKSPQKVQKSKVSRFFKHLWWNRVTKYIGEY